MIYDSLQKFWDAELRNPENLLISIRSHQDRLPLHVRNTGDDIKLPKILDYCYEREGQVYRNYFFYHDRTRHFEVLYKEEHLTEALLAKKLTMAQLKSPKHCSENDIILSKLDLTHVLESGNLPNKVVEHPAHQQFHVNSAKEVYIIFKAAQQRVGAPD